MPTSQQTNTNLSTSQQTNNSSLNFTTTVPTTEDSGFIDVSNMTLRQFCELLEIPEDGCTCENYAELCPEPIIEYNCSTSTDFVLGVIKVAIAFLGLVGNGIVLLVTFYNQRDIGQYRKLVAYLALCDFIFSILEILTSVPLLWTCKWIYGPLMCKIFSSSITFGGILPLGIIVIIAIERYFGIIKPFEKKKFLSKIWMLIVANVVICFIFIIPLLLTLQVDNAAMCTTDWGEYTFASKAYNWFILVATFILPILAISLMYYKIIQFLYSHMASADNVSCNEQQRNNRLQVNKRVVKILVAVLVAYFVLVLPNRLGWLILDNVKDMHDDDYHILKFFILLPYHFHVAINPIIYSAIDKQFKRDLISLFIKDKNTDLDFSAISTVQSTCH